MINYEKINNDISNVKELYSGTIKNISTTKLDQIDTYKNVIKSKSINYNYIIIIGVLVFIIIIIYKIYKIISYNTQRAFRLSRYKELQENLYLIRKEINESAQVDEIDKKRINYMIEDSLNLIKQYFENKVSIKTMKIEYEEIIHNYETFKHGKDYVLNNIDYILRKKS